MGAEIAVLDRLASNLDALGAREEWFHGPDGCRPGLIEDLLRELVLPEKMDEAFLRALSPRTLGERFALDRALAAWRKEQRKMEEVAVTVEETPKPEEPTNPIAVEPAVTKLELTRRAVAVRGLDLFGRISTKTHTEIAREIGTTAGTVSANLAVLRRRANQQTKVNGNAPKAAPRPPVLLAPNPTHPTSDRLEALIDALIARGLEEVEPDEIRSALNDLIQAHRGRELQ